MFAKKEREDLLKKKFNEFNTRTDDEKGFEQFKSTLLPFIERPSAHTVIVEIDGETKEFQMRILGSDVGAMESLVIDEVISVLTKKSDKSKSKNQRRRQQVSETRYGSCGNEKFHQMTLQNEDDLKRIEEKEANDKSNRITISRRRLRDNNYYNGSWEDNGSIDLASSTSNNLKLLLNIFLIKGRTELKKNIAKEEIRNKVINQLEELNITKVVLDSLKFELIELIRKLGGEYNEDRRSSSEESTAKRPPTKSERTR